MQEGLLTALLAPARGTSPAAARLNEQGLAAGGVTAREAALLAYAELLTLTPAAVTVADIGRLREAGLDDRAIHDACAIVAYFAFVNRIADGLGVEVEGSG